MTYRVRAIHKTKGNHQEFFLTGAPSENRTPASRMDAFRMVRAWREYNPYWHYCLMIDDEIVSDNFPPFQRHFDLEAE